MHVQHPLIYPPPVLTSKKFMQIHRYAKVSIINYSLVRRVNLCPEKSKTKCQSRTWKS